MKKTFLSLLLCSLPMVAIAQPNIQEAEKKVELLEKANVPTKSILGLGAVMSVFSTLFYCKKTKQAKKDAKELKKVYRWVNRIFIRKVYGQSPVQKNDHNFVSWYPKLERLGFFDQKIYVTADTFCPFVRDHYWNTLDLAGEQKNKGITQDRDMGYALDSIANNYGILATTDGLGPAHRYYKLLESYSKENNFVKANSSAIYNDIVRPQVIKIGASAFACVGFIAGLVAFHTYYKKAVREAEELKKEAEVIRN